MPNVLHMDPPVPTVPSLPTGVDNAAGAAIWYEFWYELIDTKAAANFQDLENRTLESYRQKGGGPPFIRISSRCIRYRRIDLKEWADARVQVSTANTGETANA